MFWVLNSINGRATVGGPLSERFSMNQRVTRWAFILLSIPIFIFPVLVTAEITVYKCEYDTVVNKEGLLNKYSDGYYEETFIVREHKTTIVYTIGEKSVGYKISEEGVFITIPDSTDNNIIETLAIDFKGNCVKNSCSFL